MFEEYLRDQGLEARGGQIIDATLVPVPKQRSTREENKDIKADRLPDEWGKKPKSFAAVNLDAAGSKRIGSITTATRIVSGLIPSMDLSDSLL